MQRLLIIGSGGHGRSVAEAVVDQRLYSLVGFIDDGCAPGALVMQWPVLGGATSLQELTKQADCVFVAVGNNATRERLMNLALAAGFELATVIHPRAFVSPSSIVRPGSAIMAGAIVGTEACVGVGSIVNSGAIVDHHAVVEDYGHLGVGACMAGGTVLGRSAWMQAGSALAYGVKVPAGCVLAPCQGLA
jgi:sugar O-acyltransferase (sialic acid O-acetyltransferase NeuD family)